MEQELIVRITNKIADYFPNLLERDSKNVIKVSDDSYVINLNKSIVIEYFITRFAKVLGLKVLYGAGDVNEKKQRCVLYSIPRGDYMFNVYLMSDQFGIVTKINIITFKSLEEQYLKLCEDLKETKTMRGIIYESQSLMDVTKLFV